MISFDFLSIHVLSIFPCILTEIPAFVAIFFFAQIVNLFCCNCLKTFYSDNCSYFLSCKIQSNNFQRRNLRFRFKSTCCKHSYLSLCFCEINFHSGNGWRSNKLLFCFNNNSFKLKKKWFHPSKICLAIHLFQPCNFCKWKSILRKRKSFCPNTCASLKAVHEQIICQYCAILCFAWFFWVFVYYFFFRNKKSHIFNEKTFILFHFFSTELVA